VTVGVRFAGRVDPDIGIECDGFPVGSGGDDPRPVGYLTGVGEALDGEHLFAGQA
jgi:hypothetical protein